MALHEGDPADRPPRSQHRRAGARPAARGRLQRRPRLPLALRLRHADRRRLHAEPALRRFRAGDPGHQRRQRLRLDAQPQAAPPVLRPRRHLRRLLVQQVGRQPQPRLERRHVELRPEPRVHRPQRPAAPAGNVRPAAQARPLRLGPPARALRRHRDHPALRRPIGARLLVRLPRGRERRRLPRRRPATRPHQRSRLRARGAQRHPGGHRHPDAARAADRHGGLSPERPRPDPAA